MRRLAFVVVALMVTVGGLFALVALEWKHGLGGFATSPQLIEVPFGRKVIVAGGRAILWVGTAPYPVAGPDGRPRTDPDAAAGELQCQAQRKVFRLALGERSERICDVEVTLRTLRGGASADDPRRAEVEVVWED